jgi:DNA adenine methylase
MKIAIMKEAVGEATNKKMKPLIKWAGGKYSEFSQFSHLVPTYDNYYEPFVGGGGVFFALQPKGMCFLNDKSADLIQFYRLIRSESFKEQLEEYAMAWEQLQKLSAHITIDLLQPFLRFSENKMDDDSLHNYVDGCINKLTEQTFYPLFDDAFIVDATAFKKFLHASLLDKFVRIKSVQKKVGITFDEDQLKLNIETGVKSGFYLYLRNLSNKIAKSALQVAVEKAAANWYFVREFCYGSMFRYNSKGAFNVPYGGIGYNNKNFRAKAKAITSAKTRALFENSIFYNLDFEEFLEQTAPSANDFVFLDPPYDSQFSEYDQSLFTKHDQLRLRDAIVNCKAKCMLVIKETEFIRQLYSGENFRIIDFDKTYTYNVKGRNKRSTTHLIILNY